MEGKQKQLIESYQRVLAFLEANPGSASASYAAPKQVLGEIVGRLTDHSSAQVFGTQLSRAEKTRLESLMRKLREYHLRPIVAIARSEVADQPGIADALRMPRPAAETFRAIFVPHFAISFVIRVGGSMSRRTRRA